MRLIDADALEALHCEECGAVSKGICKEDPVCATLMWLREAPTINPADLVTKGRWIVDEYDSGEPNGHSAFIEFHCPFCNEPHTLESGEYNWYYGDDIPLKFCHECGADMREPD